MSLGMQDKYKEKNSRFQLERQVAEDERTAQDMADHAMDVEPPKNGFDAFMRRYGWGILVALVVLAILGKVFWSIYQNAQTPKMLNIAGEIFVCDKKVKDPVEAQLEGTVRSALDCDLYPSEDEQTNVAEWVGQPYAVIDDTVYVYDGKDWYACHAAQQNVGGFLGEFFTPNRFHRYDRFMEETGDLLESVEAIDYYHARVMPYLTENALFKMEMERQLSRFDEYCMVTFQSVHYPVQIEVTQASLQENAYNFTVTMENRTRTIQKTFTGSYIEDKDGKIDSFTVIFPD
ncbi:MAG: hypothetical protein J6A42_08275 [Firmicutes bacterium]|nr:hypothetical protein [Bacillota bacterium]